MPKEQRLARINDELMKECANVIRQLKDPRIPALVSVLRTETTRDLSLCKVYLTMYGTDEEKAACFEAILGAAGFIRTEIARRMNLRQTPELKFIPDDSIERGQNLIQLINKVNETEQRQAGDDEL